MAPIFKGKGDIKICSCYRSVKLLEYGVNVAERVLEKWLHGIVTVDEMQFASMPERGTVDAVIILRMLPEEHHAEGKNCIFVLWTQKELLTEYKLNVGMLQGSVQSPFVLAVVVDIVTGLARWCAK